MNQGYPDDGFSSSDGPSGYDPNAFEAAPAPAPPRSVSVGEVMERAKQIWKADGMYIFKGYLPFLVLVLIGFGGLTILRVFVTWLSIPFVGSLIQLLNVLLIVATSALFFALFRPMRDVVERGQGAVAPGMGFLKLALERIVPLAIFSLAATVALGIGGCLLFLPALAVMALMYPMGFLISTEEHDLGEALSQGVEILKANIAPLAVVVGVSVGLVLFALIPVFGVGFALTATLGKLPGMIFTGLISAIIYPVLGFVVWFLVGATMIAIREGASTPAQAPGPPPASTGGAAW